MPPKKKATQKANQKEAPDSEPKEKPAATAPASNGRKRKATPSSSAPSKAPRRSARGAAATASADPIATARRLITSTVPDLARPAQEREFVASNPSARTYADLLSLTPFEELASAVVLSRPVNHALGLRTVRTIFNAPHGFTTPGAMRDAGPDERLKALYDARTQHKDKTAKELGELAEVVCERFAEKEGDGSLEKVREEAGYEVEKERELLKGSVKGLGQTGLDIFYRRVQATWKEAYPFADERSLRSLEKLGLPVSGDGLKKFVEENWGALKGELKDEKDEELAKRKAFVLAMERAVAIDLEGNIDDFLKDV